MQFLKKKKTMPDETQPLPQDPDQSGDELGEEDEEDMTAFNCVPCKGSGLVYDEAGKRHERCISCHGTGKV